MTAAKITQPKKRILYARNDLFSQKDKVPEVIRAAGYTPVVCSDAYTALKIVNIGYYAGAVIGDSLPAGHQKNGRWKNAWNDCEKFWKYVWQGHAQNVVTDFSKKDVEELARGFSWARPMFPLNELVKTLWLARTHCANKLVRMVPEKYTLTEIDEKYNAMSLLVAASLQRRIVPCTMIGAHKEVNGEVTQAHNMGMLYINLSSRRSYQELGLVLRDHNQ
jgi:hypothetical protein